MSRRCSLNVHEKHLHPNIMNCMKNFYLFFMDLICQNVTQICNRVFISLMCDWASWSTLLTQTTSTYINCRMFLYYISILDTTNEFIFQIRWIYLLLMPKQLWVRSKIFQIDFTSVLENIVPIPHSCTQYIQIDSSDLINELLDFLW